MNHARTFAAVFGVGVVLGACALTHPGVRGSVASDASADTRVFADVVVMDVPEPEPDVFEPPVDTGPVCPAGATLCGSSGCVETTTDPAHCGGCDQPCNIPGATAVCQSGVCRFGACTGGHYDCNGRTDDGCEASAACVYDTCAAVPSGAPSGRYTLRRAAGGTWNAYCDMTNEGGGWTLVLKADGASSTFRYDSSLWTDNTLLRPDSTDMTRSEAKFEGFVSQRAAAARVVFDDGSATRRALVVPLPTASTMRGLFNPATFHSTSLGRPAWTSLLATPALQPGCNREGFNVEGDDASLLVNRVRLGILGNNSGDCGSPNSRIGLGGGGVGTASCRPPGSTNTVGNLAVCNDGGPGGNVSVTVFAFVFVR